MLALDCLHTHSILSSTQNLPRPSFSSATVHLYPQFILLMIGCIISLRVFTFCTFISLYVRNTPFWSPLVRCEMSKAREKEKEHMMQSNDTDVHFSPVQGKCYILPLLLAPLSFSHPFSVPFFFYSHRKLASMCDVYKPLSHSFGQPNLFHCVLN